MANIECAYCGAEPKDTPLIPKPSFFIHSTNLHHLVNIRSEDELICLECLDYELNELKDCF